MESNPESQQNALPVARGRMIPLHIDSSPFGLRFRPMEEIVSPYLNNVPAPTVRQLTSQEMERLTHENMAIENYRTRSVVTITKRSSTWLYKMRNALQPRERH